MATRARTRSQSRQTNEGEAGQSSNFIPEELIQYRSAQKIEQENHPDDQSLTSQYDPDRLSKINADITYGDKADFSFEADEGNQLYLQEDIDNIEDLEEADHGLDAEFKMVMMSTKKNIKDLAEKIRAAKQAKSHHKDHQRREEIKAKQHEMRKKMAKMNQEEQRMAKQLKDLLEEAKPKNKGKKPDPH